MCFALGQSKVVCCTWCAHAIALAKSELLLVAKLGMGPVRAMNKTQLSPGQAACAARSCVGHFTVSVLTCYY